MIAVILTIHVLIVLALIGVVLLQRSEGGALGIGGGGGGGGFLTGRGAANALTRTTSILAALFFGTSISLAIIAEQTESEEDIASELTGEEVRDPDAAPSIDDLSRTLGRDDDEDTSSDPADDTDPPALEVPVAPDADFSVEDALDSLGADPEETAPSSEEPAEEDDPSRS
ncbi:MAG: preprotein translocase subunit SecG [Pseudomonadota bacterium]